MYYKEINFNDVIGNYTNLSSIDCKMKNYHNGMINSMHALALSQLQIIFKNNSNSDEKGITSSTLKQANTTISIPNHTNCDLSLNYYNLGVQQEYIRRKKDCEISYELSKKYCESNDTKLKKKLNLGSSEISKTTSSTKLSMSSSGNRNLIK
jgi:hypothetical protein